MHYTNGENGLEKVKKDKQLAYNLKFSESNDKSKELENWYDRVMTLRLSDKKNTVLNLLEPYYGKCFHSMAEKLVQLGDKKAYQTLIKEAKENVNEYVRVFKGEEKYFFTQGSKNAILSRTLCLLYKRDDKLVYYLVF